MEMEAPFDGLLSKVIKSLSCRDSSFILCLKKQKELAKVQVLWGFGRAGRRAGAAGRYGIIWLSRNLRSKLFKLFCCTYLVKRVIELTSEI